MAPQSSPASQSLKLHFSERLVQTRWQQWHWFSYALITTVLFSRFGSDWLAEYLSGRST